ncbi:MAG: nucleotidyl transferase AbiEii/AbiGii toxin family protein [Bdellovibrionota bacterium]
MTLGGLKERVKAVAQSKSITFNLAWQQFQLERFLARVAKSEHHDKFIFKGGLLLAQYLKIGRETKDIDFLMTKIQSEEGAIESAMKEIAAINLSDAFTYVFDDIDQLTQDHMAYPGFRVNMKTNCFEKMPGKIQVDIGVGDMVTAVENKFKPLVYKGKPIFEGEISLLVYPVETIFAEKLETIMSKGTVNSRMKDYHDVLLMIREPGLLDLDKVKSSVTTTFKTRETAKSFPIQFSAGSVDDMQPYWNGHLASLGSYKVELNMPDKLSDALAEINDWVVKKGL